MNVNSLIFIPNCGLIIDQKEKDNKRVVDALSCLSMPSSTPSRKVIDFPNSEANRHINGNAAKTEASDVAASDAEGATAVQQNQGNGKPGNPHKYGISGV